MPQLYNIEKNVILQINLINNRLVDIEPGRNDYENWIPFEFSLSVDDKIYLFPKDSNLMFTVYELRNLIFSLYRIIELKSKRISVKEYEFTSSESFFEMRIYDTFEIEELYIDFWMNIGNLTGGKHYGYDKGVRFVANLDSLASFTNNLRESFEEISSIVKRE